MINMWILVCTIATGQCDWRLAEQFPSLEICQTVGMYNYVLHKPERPPPHPVEITKEGKCQSEHP
jgi:hypothetical protein